ncbi:Uncharacterised protein [Mycobacteroides abscessus subsp. abscessus]|nr:Uncharacterised protein [Mycobacteroides abscessus subsp. abscessus]
MVNDEPMIIVGDQTVDEYTQNRPTDITDSGGGRGYRTYLGLRHDLSENRHLN